MSYNVTILGKTYELPARIIAVDDNIEAMSKLDEQYRSGAITRRDAVMQMHSFVESFAPGALPDVYEVDTNELMKAVVDIITAYDAPARKSRTESSLSEAREILTRPEVAKLLEVIKASNK